MYHYIDLIIMYTFHATPLLMHFPCFFVLFSLSFFLSSQLHKVWEDSMEKIQQHMPPTNGPNNTWHPCHSHLFYDFFFFFRFIIIFWWYTYSKPTCGCHLLYAQTICALFIQFYNFAVRNEQEIGWLLYVYCVIGHT